MAFLELKHVEVFVEAKKGKQQVWLKSEPQTIPTSAASILISRGSASDIVDVVDCPASQIPLQEVCWK